MRLTLALVVAVLGVTACQLQGGGPAPDVANARDLRVLHDARPTEVGAAADRRVGFATIEGAHYRDRRPVFLLERGAFDGPLTITRLMRCDQDAVKSGDSNLRAPRKVELWVASPSGAIAHRAAEVFQDSGEYICVRPVTALEDGVYCLHTGELADGAPVPHFAAPFIVGGVGKPVVRSARAKQTATGAELELTLANEGDGELNDAQLVVTLQRVGGEGNPEFRGRIQREVPVIAPGKESVLFVAWGIGDVTKGSYYFHGGVSDAFNIDANWRATFDSQKFDVR